MRATLSCWAVLWGISGGAIQRLTIPDALAAAGESLIAGSSVPSGPAPSLTEVLAETDLVVRGFVGAGRSYLSEDEHDVLTEWVIDDPVVIYQRDPEIPYKAGPAAPLTVIQNGGSFRVDELTYIENASTVAGT